MSMQIMTDNCLSNIFFSKFLTKALKNVFNYQIIKSTTNRFRRYLSCIVARSLGLLME